MIWSAGCERFEIEVIFCQDQDRSAVQEPQKDWYQVAVVSTLQYEVCGAWADGIWNNSWFANGWFSKFQLPGFHNRLQFNWHFGLRLAFGLDSLYYPLQHRPRFWLRFFMRFHVRFKRVCVPVTLVSIEDIQTACSTSMLTKKKSK